MARKEGTVDDAAMIPPTIKYDATHLIDKLAGSPGPRPTSLPRTRLPSPFPGGVCLLRARREWQDHMLSESKSDYQRFEAFHEDEGYETRNSKGPSAVEGGPSAFVSLLSLRNLSQNISTASQTVYFREIVAAVVA